MALDKSEGDLLANAAVPVLELFDFAPDPRFVAIFGLLAAGAQVYGPRAYLIRARLQAEKEAGMKRARQAAQPTNESPAPNADLSGGVMGVRIDPATGIVTGLQ